MKMKIVDQGNDGARHYAKGDIYEGGATDWAIKMLQYGHAEPLDGESKAVLLRTQYPASRKGS